MSNVGGGRRGLYRHGVWDTCGGANKGDRGRVGAGPSMRWVRLKRWCALAVVACACGDDGGEATASGDESTAGTGEVTTAPSTSAAADSTAPGSDADESTGGGPEAETGDRDGTTGSSATGSSTMDTGSSTGEPVPAECGDRIVSGSEACDGDDHDAMTCDDFGFDGGLLRCADDCAAFDTALCRTVQTVCIRPAAEVGSSSEVFAVEVPSRPQFVAELSFSVEAAIPALGILELEAEHVTSGVTARLVDGECLEGTDVAATFRDAADSPPSCLGVPAIAGDVQPHEPFWAFYGMVDGGGTWNLSIENFASASDDPGVLESWCIHIARTEDDPRICGDGIISEGEVCDGEQFAGFDCASLGQGTGVLACDDECMFDVSGCML